MPSGRDNGCIVDQDLVLGSASGRGLELQRLPAVVDTGLGAVSTVLLLLAIGHSLAVMAAVLYPKTVLKVGLVDRARSRRLLKKNHAEVLVGRRLGQGLTPQAGSPLDDA